MMLSGRSYLVILLMTGIMISPAGLSSSKAGPSAITPGPDSSHYRLLWGPASTHIQHVVTIVQENRAYDNYFGEYCLTVGPYCSDAGNGIPSGTCVPEYPTNLSLGCIAPYNFSARSFTTEDIPHDYASGRQAYDNGSMDGFYQAEYKSNVSFGHYNGSTIPIYWDMAEEYATSDNMFAANLSYSLPNHWFLVSGAAPNITEQNYIDTTSLRSTYLYEAERTPTIQDLLNNSSVSWKYYDFPLTSYPSAIVSGGSAYDYWNPMAGRAESYSSFYDSHFVARTQFLSDVANDSLPQISWVVPSASASDHPGYNVTGGESWVAQVVDAVEQSPEWNNTVIFVVWDDYGGWYDQVAPPHLDGNLLSFRSPFLVISPYAKEDYISHVPLNFFSLLHYVEWQFGLGCLTGLDCTASAPLDFFDFNQTARAPILFPTNWMNATYPMPLEAGDYGTPVCAGCSSVIPGLWTGPDLTITDPALGD